MDNIIKDELCKINYEYWQFLDIDYPIKISKYKHRTEIKNIKNINEIKNKLLSKLGYIPVFYFLTMIFPKYDYRGPYVFMEKGLIILYHLISGKSIRDMNDYLPFTSFHDIYNQFWDDNKNQLNKILSNLLENMFSTTTLRIINARKINPFGFKNLTLYLDGHDSRVNYLNRDINNKDFYSYKFKKSGTRTQVIYDINEFAIYVSESKPCKNYNDGQMFLNMKLENKLSEFECMAFDGGYHYYIEKFIENCDRKGNDNININNFMHPIRKQINVDLTSDEKLYNETFGSFRSKIEGCFGKLGSKFIRFNNNEKTTVITDVKIYNIQLKLSLLLLNIQKFCELYSISVKPHHMLWCNENFDYPNPYKNNKEKDIIYTFDLLRINMMTDKQDDFLNNYYNFKEVNDITYNNIEIENNTDMEDEDFEVEKIVNHRKFKKRIKFYVKWKGYDDTYEKHYL
jgi:hypothetical protein